MQHDDPKRGSRWILRVMEWDEPKAKYPNIWHDGLPSQLLLLNRAARRLRLADLIAVFYPQSQQHPERSEKFVGLARVVGLRAAHLSDHAWVDLEVAHRFAKPLSLDPAPHRVFLCCDPGWPGPEVALFRRVFDAAIAEGWQPGPAERETAGQVVDRPEAGETPETPETGETGEAGEAGEQGQAGTIAAAAPPREVAARPARPPRPPRAEKKGAGTPGAASPSPGTRAEPQPRPPDPDERTFAGVDYNGDMRDPRDRTWLAVLALKDERLRVVRLTPSGRSGIQAALRDPDRSLLRAEAVGLDFPFALPREFSETLLGGPFPEEGWWALVKRLLGLTRPAFLEAVHEFREAHGEAKRYTDQGAQALSPLHRGKRDISPMIYHGLRMLAEDRSRFAVRPFESAQGRLLLEVNPQVSARRLPLAEGGGKNRAALIERLKSAAYLPVRIEPPAERHCRDRNAALDAVISARAAAVAVLTGEVDRAPDELAPGEGERVRLEGWIYGLSEPSGA